MNKGTIKSFVILPILFLSIISCSPQTNITRLPEPTKAPQTPVPQPKATQTIGIPTQKPTEDAPQVCLPRYGDRKTILQVNEADQYYETFPTPGDFNRDGLMDIVITRLQFQSDTNFAIDILLNSGNGGMELATSQIFLTDIPVVVHPTEVIVDDFNGDNYSDIFIANSGRDSTPWPGFQNALALSNGEGQLANATRNLPQQADSTHSACASDIDNDGDIDIYAGNYWAQNKISPQILLNDGSGTFTVGQARLPDAVDLDHNGYTTCAFADVNNDKSQDLILGHYEAINNNLPVSQVLLNDGSGKFTQLPGALPPKPYDPSDKAQDIKPLDLNGDGFLDLLMVYERQADASNYVLALINNQDGTFTDESETRLKTFYQHNWPGFRATSGTPRRVLELRDMDRDGDLDLIVKTFDSAHPEPLILLNDGYGNFLSLEMDFSMRNGDLYFTFIDLINDGGLDILFALNFPPDYVETVADLGCDRNIILPTVEDIGIDNPVATSTNPVADNETPDVFWGEWAGRITSLDGTFSIELEVSLHQGCTLGQVCGTYFLTEPSCKGELTLVKIEGDVFIFLEKLIEGGCSESGYEHLSITEDGKLVFNYSPSMNSADIVTTGILDKK
ncbi:MAG: VCBS repeat-containing protein [Chloroflexota bacterium]